MWDNIEGAIYKSYWGYTRFELSRGLHMIAVEVSPEELKQCPETYGWVLDELTRRLDV